MDNQAGQIQDKILAFIRENILFTLLFISGIVLILIGLLPNEKTEEITLVQEEENAAPNSIFVDVSGAVIDPGLYELKDGSRIQDAIVLAGGFTEDADREYISAYLNLAQKLSDGAKLFIPKQNEKFEGGEGVAGVSVQSKLININSASDSELDSLPAIGTVTAEKIINNRPYLEIGDLVVKEVIGQKTFDKIKDLITVY